MPKVILASILIFALTGCALAQSEKPEGHDHEEEDEPELAELMGSLQRYAHKLGLALKAENFELAEFYMHETEETLEDIKGVEEYEEMPIGHTAMVIMDPLLRELDEALDKSDWKSADAKYAALIDGCNRCHNATEHGFIHIAPRLDANPYLQDFSAE